MNPNTWEQIKSLLNEALELSEEKRKKFVDTITNPEIRSELASLLAINNDEVEDFLKTNLSEVLKVVSSVSPNNSQFIGRSFKDFVIKEKLGEGGFGAVYRAEQVTLGREAVVKLLHQKHLASDRTIARFQQEAQLAARLAHPYAAHVYDFGVEPDGVLWIAMEFVKGIALDKFLQINNTFPLTDFTLFFEKICEVVNLAHEAGIIHRDIKPANVMIVSVAGKQVPKLLDFGIAKELSKDLNAQPYLVKNLTSQHSITRPVGSPAYMAPEQWNGDILPSPQTDIYALGVLAYQCLSGKLPFTGQDIDEIYKAHCTEPVPPLGEKYSLELELVINKAMAKEPNQRYFSAIELANEFQKAAGLKTKLLIPQLKDSLRQLYISKSPQPIAEMLANFGVSTNVYQIKEQVTSMVRLVVRFIGLIALASRMKIGSGTQKDSSKFNALVLKLYRENLDEKEWLELASEVSTPFLDKKRAFPLPELVSLFDQNNQDNIIDWVLHLQELQHISGNEEYITQELRKNFGYLSKFLTACSFLTSYQLLIVREDFIESWVGLGRIKEPNNLNSSLAVKKHPILLNEEGKVVLSLWPLLQASEPNFGSREELFFLTGKGRSGAKLTALPYNLEKQDPEFWQWFSKNIFDLQSENSADIVSEKVPYLGLSSFTPNEADLFFGREKEILNFRNWLIVSPLLALVGPSGAGKSSFIQAGIVPELAQTHQIIVLRPGATPLNTISRRLQREGIKFPDLQASLKNKLHLIEEALKNKVAQSNKKILLVVDQFEEIFTICPDQQERELLALMLNDIAQSIDSFTKVVLVLRDDFLVRTKELIGERLSYELLTSPGVKQLVEILVQPAQKVGYQFEDKELPLEMAKAVVGQPGALPMLSFAATKLWELRDRQFKQFTRKAYEAIGGVIGALAIHAEDTINQMTLHEQNHTREIFQHLITNEGTRIGLTKTELYQLVKNNQETTKVLEKLIAARLLTISENEQGDGKYEIIHETLISVWPRLIYWRQENIQAIRLRDQLRTAARHWQERGKSRGLLWRDEALAEYKLWQTKHNIQLTETETNFIQTSLADYERSKRNRKIALTIVITGLALGLSLLFWQQQKTKKQLLETLELYEEQGRQELLKEDPSGAAVYLSEAYRKGADNLSLRLMLAQAMWSVEKRLPMNLLGHKQAINSGKFSPNGELVVTASQDKIAKIWSVKTKQLLLDLVGHTDNILSAEFSPDNQRIVTASSDKTAFIWDVQTGKTLVKLLGHNEGLSSARFSPDGKLVVTASYDNTAKVWNCRTGQLLYTLTHTASIYDSKFSPDGKWIVTTSADKTIKLWDANNGREVIALKGHQGAVVSANFSENSKMLVTASIDQTAKVWDIPSGKLIATLDDHKDAVLEAKFKGDSLVVTTSQDKTIKLWNSTGKLLTTLVGHTGTVLSANFSHSGNFLITNSLDKTARVWEIATGKLLLTLSGHKDTVSFAEFSLDDNLAFTTSVDMSARFWNIAAEKRSPTEVAEIVTATVPIGLIQGRLTGTLYKPEEENLRKVPLDNSKPPSLLQNEFKTAEVDVLGNIIKTQKSTCNILVEDIVKDIKLEMVDVPSGKFMMGAPSNEPFHSKEDEEPQHLVTMPSFFMGKYEVTQNQWRAVASLPKVNQDLVPDPSKFKGDYLPVDGVSWEDAVEFCARLSKLTNHNYHLPTEAEWEYAARAGTYTPFCFGATVSDLLVNYDSNTPYDKAPMGNPSRHTVVVGSLGYANNFGIYDMHGNIWEWVLDSYTKYKDGFPTDGSAVIKEINFYRTRRGGGWSHPGVFARSAYREYQAIGEKENCGFRVACSKKTK